jgi:lipopolysaccharide/colanic/teichoic acid biosynthesis glycosyltransferase
MRDVAFGSAILKRSFDLAMSFLGLLMTFWLIAIAWVLASIETRRNGFFLQERVGRHGRKFNIMKIRTMRDVPDATSSVTTDDDLRVTRLGRFWRKTKIDELPQLINILFGDMSFVGPRPDVPGFADQLLGDERIILTVRPGITGPATLKYRDEEVLLASVEDPERFNREVLYPDKVRINEKYVRDYSFAKDIRYIYRTLVGD